MHEYAWIHTYMYIFGVTYISLFTFMEEQHVPHNLLYQTFQWTCIMAIFLYIICDTEMFISTLAVASSKAFGYHYFGSSDCCDVQFHTDETLHTVNTYTI